MNFWHATWYGLAALALLVCPLRTAYAAPPPPELREHLKPYADYLAEEMARHAASLTEEEKYREFVVSLSPVGPVVNPAEIPGGHALYEAAVYTAVLTGDFEVRLSDILAAGFWPYATFPEGIDLDLAVADNPQLCTFQAGLLEEVGTPQWLLWHRAQLLLSFYRDFFFRPPGVEDRTAADLGSPLAGFWTDPFSGEPMCEGSARGELSLTNVAVLLVDFAGAGHMPELEQDSVTVPFINTIDRPEFEFDLPSGFMRPRPH